MAETGAALDSPFWRFSIGFYRNADVAAACIALQDEAGVDVNLLLFLLWSATQKKTLSQAAVTELDGMIAPWRSNAVIPLRAVRRALKQPPPVVDAGDAEAFRTRVKAAELEAERLQQQTMYRLAPSLPFSDAASSVDAARANVAAYQATHRRTFPPAAVDTILKAFTTLSDGTQRTKGNRDG